MSDSFKKPIVKDNDDWFRRYYNGVERRKTKEELEKGEYLKAEGLHVPKGNYDITDYRINFYKDRNRKRWEEMTDREKYQIKGK